MKTADASLQAAAGLTEPGFYDLTEAEYLADPVEGGSASSTTLRRILPPGTPARVRWEADHPEPPKDAYDLGSAVHTFTLGTGSRIVEIQAPDWKTAAARTAAAVVRKGGGVPLLSKDVATARAMAQAILDHPEAGELLDPARGWPERTVIWRDQRTGSMCRAMLDFCPDPAADQFNSTIVDLKTSESADPETFARKSIARFRYHQQRAHYGAGYLAVTGRQADFVFVVVEKDPPHHVSVVRLDADGWWLGEQENADALALWTECRATGTWPGYGNDTVTTVSLPHWMTR